MAKKKSKPRAALRKHVIRSDASIGRAQLEIERVFGLPSGSIRLVLPDGRKARSDKRIGALLNDWNY